MGPDFFMYHLYFLWVRDTSAFHIGLDRIDDACLRMFYRWTGCRKHELIYAKPADLTAKVKEYDEESDAYTDVECSTDKYIKPRVKRCWVCDRVDERDNDPRLKVLCWEDIDLWVLRDPEGNGGRDRLAMQVLLRYHKGENNKMVPTWYIFIEEALPAFCPITHILAKALAEGVIANEGYQTKAEPFFTTKLNKRALKVRWKKEWLHKPVFRKTELRTSVEKKLEMEIRPATQRDALFGEGFKEKEVHREVLKFGDGSDLWEKSDDALTAAIFDGNSERLRIAMGLLEKLAQYCQRRGYAECVDTNYRRSVRDQGMRHKANSTVYQEYYNNARMNAVVQDAFQDAFLGRGTQSPYLAIFNHMGLRLDENAPPDANVRGHLADPSRTAHHTETWAGAKHPKPSRAGDTASLASTPKPDPCIFCGKTYTRTNVLWDHLDDHLERAKGGPLACPREECKGMVLESPGRFKAHAARFHGSSFRVRIKLVTSESVKPPVGSATASVRPITLVPSENQARPPGSGPMYTPTRTRIVLRIGGKKA
ncbi:hypothetical protein F4814DRAFT_449726 [Daldinia grandis]|nr:hypothetical protein F4814DRAFT_449726 [Daldinia grandis]